MRRHFILAFWKIIHIYRSLRRALYILRVKLLIEDVLNGSPHRARLSRLVQILDK